MLPNANVINDAAMRNNIALENLAHSIFENNANTFLQFLKNPQSKLDITYSQLSSLADKLQIPFGYLFLDKLPKENIKIAELRRKNPHHSISSTLKESIKISEYKQIWYRDYLTDIGEKPKYEKKLSDEQSIINKIKSLINFDILPKKPYDALQKMITKLQEENFLIFIAGRINRSNSKKLSIEDCRGYCLYDKYAPVIFLNNNDSYKGKIFTLLHELTHIFYGHNAITYQDNQDQKLEKVCNSIAGEILIPKDKILKHWNKNLDITKNIEHINNMFHLASDEAIATKARILYLVSQEDYEDYIQECSNKSHKKPYAPNDKKKVFRTIIKENSKNFVEAIISQTYNNKLDFKTAMEYLGIKKMKYFQGIQKEIGL